MDHEQLGALFEAFGDAVAKKYATGVGEDEANLRGPLEQLMIAVGPLFGANVVLSDEDLLSDVGVRPDWAVTVDGVVVGYIEAKQPDTGVNTARYTGHNRHQWERLSALPNVLYTDGNSWALYRQGERFGDICRLDGDVRDGPAQPANYTSMAYLLSEFLGWKPTPPRSFAALAETTARLCRLLRDEVIDELAASDELGTLAEEWREMLFPDQTDEAFADQYAQTVTFAMLLARAEGVELEGQQLRDVGVKLFDRHGLLGKALEVLGTGGLVERLASSIVPLQRVVGAVAWDKLKDTGSASATGGVRSPWLHFYEDFLAAYDPALRRETGSYYTPDQVVACTVRLVEETLRTHLNRPGGFIDDDVTVVDPAAGTGTYALRVIEAAAAAAADQHGDGYVPLALKDLTGRLIGFEMQTGPFAVAQLRMLDTIRNQGADIGADDLRLYVTDTLANPYVEETHLGSFYDAIARSGREANKVKADERVVVVVGNPPYRNRAKGQGGWVEQGDPNADRPPLLDSFQPPEGHEPSGNQSQELRNLYVYFWRWAIWKAFEAHASAPHGVVAFITASSWLTGTGFVGMRHHIRDLCDHLYVIDLGGQGRGGRQDENIFTIRTPVAICVAVRDGTRAGQPAEVHYRKIDGDRQTKLDALDPPLDPDGKPSAVPISLTDDGWLDVTSAAHAPISAAADPSWVQHPRLLDLLPWSTRGVEPSRTWVHDPAPDVLKTRWDRLVSETDPSVKKKLFKPSYHAAFDGDYPPLPGHSHSGTIRDETGPCPDPVRVIFRSFDRQWLIPDRRVIHSPSPNLWRAERTPGQIFLSHNHADPAGHGPATVVSAHMPIQGHFNARNDTTIPLWRDPEATIPNVAPGLLDHLSASHGKTVTADDLMAYIVAVTSHPAYASHFWDQLDQPGLRVPVTTDVSLWDAAMNLGYEIVWLHTYGQRYSDPAAGRPAHAPRLPDEQAPKIDTPIPTTPDGIPDVLSHDPDTATLHVGAGTIVNVPAAVYSYEISGMNVLDKWFSYRRATPAGKHSSPLDKLTADHWTKATIDELVDLLHVLGRVVALHEDQADLLTQILDGPLLTTGDLEDAGVLPVPKSATQAPTDEEVAQPTFGL